jgi:hypothetical protein
MRPATSGATPGAETVGGPVSFDRNTPRTKEIVEKVNYRSYVALIIKVSLVGK